MNRYGKLSAEFYALDKPEAPPDAFDFYERQALAIGGPIHEPMCGSGRFLLPLLARGLSITGSDSSAEMLALCREGARQLGRSVHLSHSALDQLSLAEAPRLIFIPSGSFGLLIDDASVAAALARLFQVLAPGGTLLLEAERLVATEPQTSGVWGGRWVERDDGAKLVLSWLSQYSGSANVSQGLHRYELVKDGQLLESEYEDFRVRSYEADELRGLVEAAGFSAVELLKAYDEAPPDHDDDAFVLRCRKPTE